MNRVNNCIACANLRHGIKTKIDVEHTCGKSHEEIESEREKGNKNTKRLQSMLKALAEITKVKENQGKIVCPECGGDLHFTRASSNGHVWGKCKTQGCLSWMQ